MQFTTIMNVTGYIHFICMEEDLNQIAHFHLLTGD